MADEGGFDPCECVWGQEMAMRRLLSLLRQSQSHCTDTECFQTVDGNQNLSDNFLFTTLIIAFALLMYYFRPQSASVEGPSKPANNDNGSNGFPPTPPTLT
ncbi:hypothetical protein RI129_006188 [Pyrocoelia pectoralis]|uniref:Small integral membrane protein 14 n=1 Tax=Pyrocoelia pectoralis TaxID=417401 RepID=A0AAN7ZND9_9COLE